MNEIMNTEQEVKDYLGIQDFRNVKKDQVIKLVSALGNINPTVAVKCIEQFPEFAKSATLMIQTMSTTCEKAFSAGNEETRQILEIYKPMMDKLSEQFARDDFSETEKEILSRTIVNLGNQLVSIREAGAQERVAIIDRIKNVAISAIAVCGAILGTGYVIKNGGPQALPNGIKNLLPGKKGMDEV